MSAAFCSMIVRYSIAKWEFSKSFRRVFGVVKCFLPITEVNPLGEPLALGLSNV